MPSACSAFWCACPARVPWQDLFQHTFLRLAEAGPRLPLDSNLRAWLFSVARNAFLSHARARAVESRADVTLIPAPSGAAGGPDESLALDELERAVYGLNREDRELLLLIGVEGLSYAEAADVLRVDQVTVRKRVSRARSRLAQALDDQAKVVAKSERSQ